MNKLLQFAAACVVLMLANLVQAEYIQLKDGSQIQGKILSMENGTYTVQTDSMGVIRLRQQQIQSISQQRPDMRGADAVSPTSSGANSVAQSTMQSLQSSMTNNPGVMSMIMSLQSDPDMQAVLSDPEVMAAISNFDLEKLKNHPKILKLMQNRKIQSIQGNMN